MQEKVLFQFQFQSHFGVLEIEAEFLLVYITEV